MPLHVLQLDSGTEYLLPWTRNKLNFWHAEAERSGQTLVRKTVQVSDGSVIHARSQSLGNGGWMGKIRITGVGNSGYASRPTIRRIKVTVTGTPIRLVAAGSGTSSAQLFPVGAL